MRLALRRFTTNIQKPCINTALRIVNNATEAEMFYRKLLWMHSVTFAISKTGSSFGAWLKQIVVNKSVTHLRRKKQDWIDIESAALPEIKEEDVVDEGEIRYQVNQVLKGIQQLPNGYRTVLSLYLLEGYDHEEISEILVSVIQPSEPNTSVRRKDYWAF
jgi:RNA polymerase sigma-70 factor (ECF subfamily)